MDDKWEMLIIAYREIKIFSPSEYKSIPIPTYIEARGGRWLRMVNDQLEIEKGKLVPFYEAAILYVLSEGWEPYAVHGSDGGTIYSNCFRKKINY